MKQIYASREIHSLTFHLRHLIIVVIFYFLDDTMSRFLTSPFHFHIRHWCNHGSYISWQRLLFLPFSSILFCEETFLLQNRGYSRIWTYPFVSQELASNLNQLNIDMKLFSNVSPNSHNNNNNFLLKKKFEASRTRRLGLPQNLKVRLSSSLRHSQPLNMLRFENSGYFLQQCSAKSLFSSFTRGFMGVRNGNPDAVQKGCPWGQPETAALGWDKDKAPFQRGYLITSHSESAGSLSFTSSNLIIEQNPLRPLCLKLILSSCLVICQT